MGGRDKGLVVYQGRALIDHVIARVAPQVEELIISANRNLDDYARRGFQVVTDGLPGFQGPLAGVLAGLQVARHEWVLTLPCDMPRLPEDLASRLYAARAGLAVVVADDGSRTHPAVMLLHTGLADLLADYLAAGGRSVHGFQACAGFVTARVEAAAMVNLNSLDGIA